MACNCNKRKKQQFAWTPPAGSTLQPMTYATEIEAKAKVMRKGGTYTAIPLA